MLVNAVRFVFLPIVLFGGIMSSVYSFFEGLKGRAIEQRTAPNQGVRRSLRNGLIADLILLLGGGLLSGLVTGSIAIAFVMFLLFLPIAVVAFFTFGGFAAVQHAIVRRVLASEGQAPRNFADFLDFAASRVLLRKVGGGYIFIHRMLMNYFAELEEKEKAKTEPTDTLFITAGERLSTTDDEGELPPDDEEDSALRGTS
jgi:hypothetical protein